MAVAADGEAIISGDQAAAATWTFAGKTSAGSDRIGVLRFNIATSAVGFISAVTWGGNAMTEVPSSSVAFGARTNKSYYIVSPPTTGSDVVVTHSSGTPAGEFVVTSYNGADTANPIGDVQIATGTSTTPSVAVSSATGDLVLDIMGVSQVISACGQTSEFTDSTGGSYRVGASRQVGAATVTMSWTVGSAAWGTAGFNLNAAGGGGGGRIWKLAGDGGGLVGPARGLAA